jgi:hypothetical protein
MAKRPSTTELRRACGWFAGRLGISDCEFSLSLDATKCDGELACVITDPTRKKACIALDLVLHDRDGEDWLSTLAHELFHVACRDSGLSGDARGQGEYIVNCIGDVLAELYRKNHP